MGGFLGRSRPGSPQARALSGVGGPEPLTIVRAPHGFGKSTLAAQWLRALQEEDLDVLWLGADIVPALHEEQVAAFWTQFVARLVEDTGGWPALVRVVLAGTAVAHHGGDEVTIDLDAGCWSLRAAWDEFATPGLADLVLRTSLLAEFTAEQAEALCPGIDVKAGISALQGAGLVRTRLVAGTAVHSHLTAVRHECVQRRRPEQPDLFGELSRTVARELLADGRTGAAVVHLVRARLWDALVESVETGWRALVGYGEHELLGLLERLPAEVVARSARLIVLRDYVAVRSSGPDAPGAAPASPGSLAPLLHRVY